MKTIWFFLLCFFCSLTYGQVGIGTTDPQGALDVSSSTNGGLLVPRYALSGNNDTSSVVNPSGMALLPGTLVYNTTAVTGTNALEAGFVSYNGSTWDEVTPTSSAIYGQIFKTSNTDGTNVSTAVQFGTNSISNGTTLNTSNVQTGSVTGLYRVTFTINIQRINGVNSNIEFFLTQGFGAANKVTGSSAWASVRGGAVRASMTKTVLVDVNSVNQQFYVFPATTNANVRILPDSSILVELVQAD